jgi:hypothetical protein
MRRVTAMAALVVLAACSYFYRVTGDLAAEDGVTGVACSVAVYDGTHLEATCMAEGAAPPHGDETIGLGGRFHCHPSGNLDAVFELRVRCPGYAPLDHPLVVRSCAGSFFGGCDDIDVGTLVVRRAP